MKIIKNVRLYGELTDITVDGGKIVAIGKTDKEGVDFGGNKIYPGLIDTHSHGCIGLDASDADADLGLIADYELEHGITTWYPTTTTSDPEELIIATNKELNIGHGANMPGVHMEGPFINKNYKGAQNEDYIQKVSREFFDKCNSTGNVKKISLAPEEDGAIEFIKSCPAVVSLGHTDTDYDTAMAAFRAGATCLTHTYNRMPGIHHRFPGPIGAGSDSEGVYAELICDGVHIHQSAVRMLIKIFGYDRVVLISDSIRALGLNDGEYTLGGQRMIVKDGIALTEDGHLSGSTTNLFDCVRVAISFGIPEERAVQMASLNPARMMGLNKGKIEVGYDADFIIVDNDFNLVKAIARGEF